MTKENTAADLSRVRFIEHRGKSILLQDLSGLMPGQEFRDLIAKARGLIAAQPPKSALTLLDATDTMYNMEVLATLKEYAKANTPYIKCTAVVGITGLKEIGLAAVSKAAGRPLRTFATREAALDYLAGLE
jgi:hypothetical protein